MPYMLTLRVLLQVCRLQRGRGSRSRHCQRSAGQRQPRAPEPPAAGILPSSRLWAGAQLQDGLGPAGGHQHAGGSLQGAADSHHGWLPAL